jgi:hypothetical protein
MAFSRDKRLRTCGSPNGCGYFGQIMVDFASVVNAIIAARPGYGKAFDRKRRFN